MNGEIWIGMLFVTQLSNCLNTNPAPQSVSCGFTDCDENLDLGGGTSIDLVLISGGTFDMGSPGTENGRGSDETQHHVTLTNDIYVMTTEVTQGMFSQLMGYESHHGLPTTDVMGSYGVGSDHPAYYVHWHMAAAFANKATTRHNTIQNTNLQQCYSCSGSGTAVRCTQEIQPYTCSGYRLLTEAEWEYAARAGTAASIWTENGGGDIPSGYAHYNGCSLDWTLSDGSILGEGAWFCANNDGSSYGSKEVATQIPNDFGLYDMNGNVWEWTHDRYAPYTSTSQVNPVQTDGSLHVVRGGDWFDTPDQLRSAARSGSQPTQQYSDFGFRLGRTAF